LSLDTPQDKHKPLKQQRKSNSNFVLLELFLIFGSSSCASCSHTAHHPTAQESDRSTHLQQQLSTKIPTQHTQINQTANGVHGQKSNSAGELKTGTGRPVCANQMNPAAPGLDLEQVLWRGLENYQREDSPQRQDEQKGLPQRDKSTKGSWNHDPARGPAQN
jgi:hypothetical protein